MAADGASQELLCNAGSFGLAMATKIQSTALYICISVAISFCIPDCGGEGTAYWGRGRGRGRGTDRAGERRAKEACSGRRLKSGICSGRDWDRGLSQALGRSGRRPLLHLLLESESFHDTAIEPEKSG